MKIILSPAKSIDFDMDVKNPVQSQPLFLSDSEKLVKKLKKLKAKDIMDLMKVSESIAELNVNRFNEFEVPFTSKNAKAAADIFTGAAYQGLDYPSLSDKNRLVGQEYLRILSGLYGLLKPLDLIQPYRLEMGTRFKYSAKTTNLYQFWGDKILNELNKELAEDESPILVNLASSEYFKAAKLKSINANVITPIFKDRAKSGDYKVIMTFAKKARGLMSRYIIQNELKTVDDLKGFDLEGYSFLEKESTEDSPVFIRG